MNVYYEIKEHLTLYPGADLSVPYLVSRRLAMLGADMLLDDGSAVDRLRVRMGTGEVVFSGQEVTPALKEAIQLLYAFMKEENEETLEMDLTYGYIREGENDPFSERLGPFELCGFLDGLGENALERLSYVMWSKADEDPGMGTVVCYGRRSDGAVCRGEAAYETVCALPEDAVWYTEESTFSYYGTPFPESLYEACRRLSVAAGNPSPESGETFCEDGEICQSYPDLTRTGPDQGEYYLNFVSLPDRQSAEAFTSAMAEVLRLTGEEKYVAELLDTGARRPRMLRLTVTPERTLYEITRV